jgi:hypothetical protein
MFRRRNQKRDRQFFAKKSLCLVVLAAWITATGGILNPQMKIPRPLASFEIPNPVPIAIVRLIASAKAREIGGNQISSGDVIYCSDGSGKVNSYMFVFKLGARSFPEDEEILASVRKGIAYEQEILENRIPEELKALIDPGEIGKKLRDMSIPLYRSDGTLSGMARKIVRDEILKLAMKLRFGVDEYLTIYVSSSYDNFPIPHYKKSLPPYYHSYETAMNEACKILGSESVFLSKYYFLGVRGEFFGFTDSKTDILLDPVSKTAVMEKEKFLKPNLVSRISENEKQKTAVDIKKEWEKLTKIAQKEQIK